VTVPRLALPERWVRLVLFLLVAGDIVAGVALRFWTKSLLWLDESQTVNIASHPLSQLTHYLRDDGAPPLYYVLLHVWMGVAGHSDHAVRALSGVISVLGILAAYFAAKAFWNWRVGLLAAAIVAILPFPIYFGTEVRMYSLVMLETTLILWALKSFLDRPRVLGAIWVLLGATALLYTQYWGIYFDLMLVAYAALHWYRHRQTEGRAVWLVGAAVGAFVLWLPWFPIFNEQRIHTGTPWAAGATIFDQFSWFGGLTVNQSVPHVLGSLHSEASFVVLVALFVIGLFGTRMVAQRSTILMDFAGSPAARLVAFFALFTMVLGLLVSHFSTSAYVPRYMSVVAIPVCLICAIGLDNLGTSLRILLVLAILSGAALWTDKWGVGVQRTEAGVVASGLTTAPSGSLVFVCPDQLGPSLLRYANPNLTYIGYPRFTTPAIVNWYDYLDVYAKVKPAQLADRAAAMVKPGQNVYVVRAQFYGLHTTCWAFATHLARDLHRTDRTTIPEELGHYYQVMQLDVLAPRGT
jgi:hypothetical protein